MKGCCVVIFLTALYAPCFAGGDIFLYPRVEGSKGGMVFADIAKIEADAGTAIRIGGIIVDGARTGDGYIDRKEVMDILKESGVEDVSVYGSGVRVLCAEPEDRKSVSPESVVVKRGKPVRFQVVSPRMRVEVAGTAMQDGAVGDLIQVKLKGTAVSRGRILNDRVVELAL